MASYCYDNLPRSLKLEDSFNSWHCCRTLYHISRVNSIRRRISPNITNSCTYLFHLGAILSICMNFIEIGDVIISNLIGDYTFLQMEPQNVLHITRPLLMDLEKGLVAKCVWMHACISHTAIKQGAMHWLMICCQSTYQQGIILNAHA